ALPASMFAHLIHYLAAFLGAVLGVATFMVKRDRWAAPVFALLLFIGAGLQIVSRAYTADFAGYPDESAHFVTSVMFSELFDAPIQHPMRFASRYYLQYPRLGIGHWPPLGY